MKPCGICVCYNSDHLYILSVSIIVKVTLPGIIGCSIRDLYAYMKSVLVFVCRVHIHIYIYIIYRSE